MKYIFLMFLLPFIGFSQNPNFKIEDKTIIWQWVYNDSLDLANIKQNLKLEFLTDTTGKLKRTNFNDKNLREQIAEFKIEEKQGRYRVTVFNIKIIPMQVSFDLGGISSMPDDLVSFEDIMIKNNGTMKAKLMGFDITEALNKHYLDLFIIKKRTNEDW